MKKTLLTCSLLILSFYISSAVSAQEVPGGFADGRDAEYFDPPGQFTITNYPNPVNTYTTIKYGIPSDGNVSLKLYDSNGRLIKVIFAGYQKAGFHTIHFNASNLSRGIYVSKLSVTSGVKNTYLSGRINVVK